MRKFLVFSPMKFANFLGSSIMISQIVQPSIANGLQFLVALSTKPVQLYSMTLT